MGLSIAGLMFSVKKEVVKQNQTAKLIILIQKVHLSKFNEPLSSLA
jgi:hypothetical protein